MAFRVQILKESCQSLKLSTVVLDQVLMREEQDV